MKKIILSTTILFTILTVKAQTVYIPDSVFKAYLVADTAINTNFDTEIQITEADSYTGNIIVSGLMITDLTGIEAFISLSKLYCSHTPITNINLSNNSSITEVYCEHSQVNSLNVSGCTSLTRLDCYDNQISSLIIDNCPSLISLDCCVNQITSIDVSNCPAFNTLFCCSNLLTSLNIKNGNNYNFNVFHAPNNPGLSCVEVDDPAWSTLNWTDKDSIVIFSTDCTNHVDGLTLINDSKIYPNPFKDYFYVSLANDFNISNTDITLLNLLGQKQSVTIHKSESQFRIYGANLDSGPYIVVISGHNGINIRLKIIKE